jgi:hypothetical protein
MVEVSNVDNKMLSFIAVYKGCTVQEFDLIEYTFK